MGTGAAEGAAEAAFAAGVAPPAEKVKAGALIGLTSATGPRDALATFLWGVGVFFFSLAFFLTRTPAAATLLGSFSLPGALGGDGIPFENITGAAAAVVVSVVDAGAAAKIDGDASPVVKGGDACSCTTWGAVGIKEPKIPPNLSFDGVEKRNSEENNIGAADWGWC